VKVRISDPTKDVVDSLGLTIYRNDAMMQTINMANDSITFPRVQQGQDYIFKYKFKPAFGEGKYKLDFQARTNQIVGVAQNPKADDTVKIGAVHLTVAELREVENGIVENVALKGFIDSLLGNQYQNFSANLGHNDFLVDVKRAENKFDQIQLYPQDEVFTVFPGLELPNPIRIEGALSSKTELTKIEGPGEFKKVDTNWVWTFNPAKTDIGQTYTVRFKGDAKRGGGPKDITTKDFSVKVEALQPAAGDTGVYIPLTEDDNPKPQPYTKFPFVVNGKYTDLNGFYKIVITVDGKEVKVSNEPTATYTPVYLQDEDKKMNVKILFRSEFGKDYTQLRSDDFTVIAPPILLSIPKRFELGGSPIIKLQAGVGLEASGSDYQSELPGDLDVQSDENIFDSKAVKGDGFNYTLRMIKPPSNVKKDGKPVKITFKDPKTGMSGTKTVVIFPKKK
jgi:hypothetical protein